MNEQEMQQFIADNIELIPASDKYLQQYLQARAAYDAVIADIDNGSPTAATDLVMFTIGCKVYPICVFNADASEAMQCALIEIMQTAIENIHLARPDQIV